MIYYTAMTSIWGELALIESAILKACKEYITDREKQLLIQFFIALRSDFEEVRGSALHCTLLPSIDSLVSEIMVEKTRL